MFTREHEALNFIHVYIRSHNARRLANRGYEKDLALPLTNIVQRQNPTYNSVYSVYGIYAAYTVYTFRYAYFYIIDTVVRIFVGPRIYLTFNFYWYLLLTLQTFIF